MQGLLDKAKRAAASDAPILLTGESGTGKGVIAHQIHRWSARARDPLVTINCTGHSQHLLESELFGHMRGAFNGAARDKPGGIETAHAGSIVLDEISDLLPPLQTKLLHFIKEQSFERMSGGRPVGVDARIIAASSRDLVSEVAERRFREDLYYRLGVIALRVPSLCQRQGDILPLANRMLADFIHRNHRLRLRFSADASSALLRYRWPGNIRELRNVVERAVTLCQGEIITSDLLRDIVADSRHPTAIPLPPSRLVDVEREHIARVVANSPTLEDAAHRLGINVTTLWRRRKRYGLDRFLYSKPCIYKSASEDSSGSAADR